MNHLSLGIISFFVLGLANFHQAFAACGSAKVLIIDKANTRDSQGNGNVVGFGVNQQRNTKEANNYCAWVNGSLVHPDGSVVGTIVDNNSVIMGGTKNKIPRVNDQIKWVDPKSGRGNFADTNGIFGMKKNGGFFLIRYEEQNQLDNSEIQWAFQNGPILLSNGENPHNPNSTSNYYRTGIGFINNKLIVLSSTQKCNLHDFGMLFKEKYNVDNAIYLDGYPDQRDYIGMKSSDTDNTNVLDGRYLLQFFKPNGCTEIISKIIGTSSESRSSETNNR